MHERGINQCWYTAGMYICTLVASYTKYIAFNCLCCYSAGVGRSGMFIAIDTEIQHIKKKSVIDIYNCVRKMRFWRNFMVQTTVS